MALEATWHLLVQDLIDQHASGKLDAVAAQERVNAAVTTTGHFPSRYEVTRLHGIGLAEPPNWQGCWPETEEVR